MTILLPLLAFLFVSLLVVGCSDGARAELAGNVIERRLGEIRGINGLPIEGTSAYGDGIKRSLKRLGQRRRRHRRPRWASCSSGSSPRDIAAAKRCLSSLAFVSAARSSRSAACRRRSSASRTCCWRSAPPPSATCCPHRAGADGEEAPAPDSAVAARRPRPAGGERRGWAWDSIRRCSEWARSSRSRTRSCATSCV